MNLGLSIFLSAILICCVWLYYITKDRWNWKKILFKTSKYLGLLILGFAIIVGLVYLFEYVQSENKKNNIPIIKNESVNLEFVPFKVNSFWDITLGTNKNDVIFYRGTPTKKINDKIWLYEWGKKDEKNLYSLTNYWVKTYLYFSDDSVTAVLKFYDGLMLNETKLFDKGWYRENSERIFGYLGKPEITINYNQDLNRIYIYSSYNCVFFLKANTTYGYGIFDTDFLEYYKKEFVKF